MSQQFAIIFDTDVPQADLQEALDSDGVFGTLADKFGAYPFLVTLTPGPAPAPTTPPTT